MSIDMQPLTLLEGKGVILQLTIHTFGVERTVKHAEKDRVLKDDIYEGERKEVDLSQEALPFNPEEVPEEERVGNGKVDKDTLKLFKTLLVSPELKAINTLYGRVKRYVQSMSVPFNEGFYILNPSIIAQVWERLDLYEEQEKALVREFVENAYERRVAEQKRKLGPFFREGDYPSKERLYTKFGIERRLRLLSTPDSVEGISAEILKTEREKAKAEVLSVMQDAKLLLREEFRKIVDNLIDRLAPKEEGKRTRFTNATTDNLRKWLELFEARDIAGDSEMKRLVDEAKGVLGDKTMQDMKNSLPLREGIRNEFSRLREAIDSLPVIESNSTGRLFDLED